MPSGDLGRRCAITCVLICLLLGSACKGDKSREESSDEQPSVELGAAETDLVDRRAALLETRRALALQRAELDEKKQELEASGQDTTIIEKQVSALAEKEREVRAEELNLTDELLGRLKDQQAQLASVAGKLSGGDRVTVRESAVASRERSLAEREKDLATREAAFARLQVESAKQWQESCSTGAPIFSMPSSPAGTKYKKRDVERHLKKATQTMRKRGILTADLPAPLRNALRSSQTAMKKGDYAQAYYMAEQLAKEVGSLQIGRNFVKAKFDRVNRTVSGNLSDGDAKLLTKITRDYGDGRYEAANRRLNELISRQN